jgi:hypothetical protein
MIGPDIPKNRLELEALASVNNNVTTHADRARILPTLKSIPADIMTKVIPKAIIPISETCLIISVIFSGSRKIIDPLPDLGLIITPRKIINNKAKYLL